MKINSIFFIIFLLIICVAKIDAQTVLNTPVKDIEGNITTIEEVASGDILVLDFWVTWCKPCIKSIPKLSKLSENYKGKNVRFIGINEDSPRNLIKVKPFTNSLEVSCFYFLLWIWLSTLSYKC